MNEERKYLMFITIIFFLFTLIGAETEKDRYVVRENTTFQMDCIHKLKNVTRVRWEYIKTHDNRSETIYDSQSNGTLNTGFEIFCQPHETFISICILKLVQVRKEDSGKYICYVGDKSETKPDSNLKPIVEIELVIKGPVYKTLVVKQREAVVLPCEHKIKNLTRARWSHVSLQGVMTYAIYHLPAKETSNKNYESLCEPHELYCNLKILQANKESAGRYICMVGESLEFEKKYGLDQMTHFIEIQLVVGELLCNEHMNKDLTLLGENDCYGIEADVLNLKCSFNYFGNINYHLLLLRWIEKYKFNSLEKKLNSSLIKHEVKDGTNKISIQINLSVAYEMQHSIFLCVLDDTLVKPCQLHEFRTQYAKNTTKRSPPMHSNDLHNIKCSAIKSANVQCSYYWVHEIGGATVENPYAILPVENMNSPGNYTCIAKCHLGKHRTCIIKAMEFEVVQESRLSGLNIGLISTLIVVMFIAIVIMITFILIKRCLKSRRKDVDRKPCGNNNAKSKLLSNNIEKPGNQCASHPLSSDSTPFRTIPVLEIACEKDDLLDYFTGFIENSSSPLEIKQASAESNSTNDYDNTNSKLSRDENIIGKNHSLSDSSASSATSYTSYQKQSCDAAAQSNKTPNDTTPTSYPSTECEIASEIQKVPPRDNWTKSHGLFAMKKLHRRVAMTRLYREMPLEVKETLVRRTSEHGDFMIFESNNDYHTRVLMINEALWDASYEGYSSLEYMTIYLMNFHVNPKKVLIFGRCEGRIVRAFLRHFCVESIVVCEDASEAKELSKSYCQYFPELASNLDDPKVHNITGGVDFLKNQQNVFDVIITRSSYKNADPNNGLFSYEYCESVKSALIEGGIAMLIVSGKSAAESKGSGDFVERDIQCFCKRIFSVVEYLQFQNFCHIDHSSGLTRFLICGHNPKKNLKEVSTRMYLRLAQDQC